MGVFPAVPVAGGGETLDPSLERVRGCILGQGELPGARGSGRTFQRLGGAAGMFSLLCWEASVEVEPNLSFPHRSLEQSSKFLPKLG